MQAEKTWKLQLAAIFGGGSKNFRSKIFMPLSFYDYLYATDKNHIIFNVKASFMWICKPKRHGNSQNLVNLRQFLGVKKLSFKNTYAS